MFIKKKVFCEILGHQWGMGRRLKSTKALIQQESVVDALSGHSTAKAFTSQQGN